MLPRLAAVLSLLACTAYAQQVKRVTVSPTPRTSGPEMFRAYCSPCHGVSGKGDGPAAPALKKQPLDLTKLAQENGGKFPAARVARVLEEFATPAHGSRDMPVWGDVFRALEHDTGGVRMRVINLTKHVESLQQ